MYDKWFAAALFCAFVGCNGGGPKPKPTPNPTVEPTPTPVPSPTADMCPVLAVELVDSQEPGILVGEVRAAQQAIGDVCGLDPELSLCELASTLRASGREAYFGTDAVWLKRDRFWEEHHAVFYGNGCWLSNTWYGTFEEAQ